MDIKDTAQKIETSVAPGKLAPEPTSAYEHYPTPIPSVPLSGSKETDELLDLSGRG